MKPSGFARYMTLEALEDRYCLTNQVIGRGSYATVKLGRDKISQRKVAIKVYEKQKLETSSQRRSNLVQEIQNLDWLSHPRVVKLLDRAEDSTHIYLVLEFIEGIPLNKYIQRRGSKSF